MQYQNGPIFHPLILFIITLLVNWLMHSLLLLLLAYFANGAKIPSQREDARTLRNEFEKRLREFSTLLTGEVMIQMEQVLYCEHPIQSDSLDHLNFEGNLNLKVYKTQIIDLQTTPKTRKQYEDLIGLFWSAFEYVNFLMFENKKVYVRENPDCIIDNLIALQKSNTFQMYCYNFTYYSLLYVAYFQFVSESHNIVATPHKFAFSELSIQLKIINDHYKNNPKKKNSRLAAKSILLLLKDFTTFKYRYESQIALLLKPSEGSDKYAGSVLAEYNKNIELIEQNIRSYI